MPDNNKKSSYRFKQVIDLKLLIKKRSVYFFLLGTFGIISYIFLATTFLNYDRGIIENALIQSVQNNINLKIKTIQQQEKILQNSIQKNNGIGLFNKDGGNIFSTHIYKNGKIFYWCDNNYYPDYSAIKDINGIKYIKVPAGKYLVYKKNILSQKDVFECFSFIRLTHKYAFKNKYLKSGLEQTIFPEGIISITRDEINPKICSEDGEYLFSLEFENNLFLDNTRFTAFLLVAIISLVCFFLSLMDTISNLNNKFKYDISFAYLIVFELGIRLLMSFLNIDNEDIASQGLFNSDFFSSLFSSIPSIVFVNTISILGVCYYFLINFTHLHFVKKLLKWTESHRKVWILLLLVILLAISLGFFLHLKTVFYNSPNIIRLVVLEDFTINTLFILLNLVMAVIIYFIITHLIARYFLQSIEKKDNSLFLIYGVGMIAIALFYFLVFENSALIFIGFLSLLYLLVVVVLKLPFTIQRLRYVTYIYFFLCAVLCSLFSAIATYEIKIEKLGNSLQNTAEKINKEGLSIDLPVLQEISNRIKRDVFIRSGFTNPLYDRKAVEQKIEKIYINTNFEKFDCNVYLFDENGYCLNKAIKSNYFNYYNRYNKLKYKTAYKGIFQIPGIKPVNYNFIPLRASNGQREGFIVLELKTVSKKTKGVFPELLLSHTNAESEKENYSYAVYKKNKLLYSEGDFNYHRNLLIIDTVHQINLSKGEPVHGFYHKLYRFSVEGFLIMSAPYHLINDTFSNFSFFFLLQAVIIAFFILSNTFYYKIRQVSNTLTTKIQIFINFAFFLPLVVVSFTTYAIISKYYQGELQKDFIEKAENISEQTSNSLTELLNGKTNLNALTAELLNVSNFVRTDINVYDAEGKLISTTQPEIFDSYLLSNYINPHALEEIRDRMEPYDLVQETIGTLKFNTIYYVIKSFETGKSIGILSIPYFESKEELQKKLLDVLSFIMNIFTSIFILFLGISYFASKFLTVPLTLLTNKLKNTSLNKLNEPLIYTANDEIGFMVKEYNKMLINLENSKESIIIKEKESAWNEMARQVAHEIKNPLTPMKLTLQNMQRMIKNKVYKTEQIDKSIGALLDQIDNLSEIATSFSSFTQLPIPKREIVNLTDLLDKIVFLFENKIDSKVTYSKLTDKTLYVLADEKLLGRIFINILTNAFESVPNEKEPLIIIGIQEIENDFIRINFCDNGEGISTENRTKVFELNFSTKSTGYGIGLVVAKKGIEQMDGKIWFERNLGEGTCFYIDLKQLVL